MGDPTEPPRDESHALSGPIRPTEPANAAGDFYVEAGCCLQCSIPPHEAPELFDWDSGPSGSHSCYVKRQPANAAELAKMLRVFEYSDLGCIRYCGRDPMVQWKLAKSQSCDIIDHPLPGVVGYRMAEALRLRSRASVGWLESLRRAISRVFGRG